MAQDRYTQWLKIAPGARPPDHYALLGLPHFCGDAQRIEQASHDRLDELDKHALSHDAASRADCQRMMNEVARARVVLMDAGKRLAYDVELAGRLGDAPPQVVVMPVQEPREARAQARSAPVVKREPLVSASVPMEPVRRWSVQHARWACGAAVGIITVIVLLILFITKDHGLLSPSDSDASSMAATGPQPTDNDSASKMPVVVTHSELEQARAKCMARLQECKDDASIMPLIDEWGQRDWQYILAAIEQAENVAAMPTFRTVQYEKAFDKLGEVMAHARRTAQIIRTTRGPYDEAAAMIDEKTIRTQLPTEWAAIQRSLRNATIGALNHRTDHAKQHFEQAAKLYRDAAGKARSMNRSFFD